MDTSTNVGTVGLKVGLDTKSFYSSVSQTADKAGNILSTGLSGQIKKIGTLLAGAFAVTRLVSFAKECVSLGSSLTEVQNVIDTTFSDSSVAKINKFATAAVTNLGMSETTAKKMVGTFGAMATSFGFTDKQALSMSESLTELASGVSSFYNISEDESYTKLKSVFTGETESLKELGVVMTQSALDEYALQNGYGKTTAKMTEQEKVALRYSFVMNQLSKANGDFAKTMGSSWANQTRVLSQEFDAIKASLGQGLINALMPAIKMLNTFMAKLVDVASAFKDFTASVWGTTSATTTVSDSLEGASGTASELADSMSDIASSAAATAKSLMGFDMLNRLDDTSSPSTSAGSSSAIAEGDSLGSLDSSSGTVSKLTDKLTGLKKVILGTKKEFFDMTKGIQDNCKSIWNSFKSIFGSKDVISASENLMDTMFSNTTRHAKDFGGLGVSIVQSLTGGISKALADNKDRIHGWITKTIDIRSDVDTIETNIYGDLCDVLSAVLGDRMVSNISATILKGLGTVAGTVLTLLLEFEKEFDSGINRFLFKNKSKLIDAGKGLVDTYGKYAALIIGIISDACEGILGFARKYLMPFASEVQDGIGSISSAVMGEYKKFIKPTIDGLIADVGNLWNKHLKPYLSSLATLIGNLITILGQLWKNVLVPLINWAVKNLAPVFKPIINMLKDTGYIVGVLFDNLKSILDIINGIISAAGKMGSALNNAVNTDVGKTANSALDKITDALSYLNGAKGLEYLAGAIFGHASGCYVAANTPQLAMIGDNTTEGEFVAPESKLHKAVADAITEAGLGGTSSSDDRVINLYIGEEKIDSIVLGAQKRRNKRNGGR